MKRIFILFFLLASTSPLMAFKKRFLIGGITQLTRVHGDLSTGGDIGVLAGIELYFKTKEFLAFHFQVSRSFYEQDLVVMSYQLGIDLQMIYGETYSFYLQFGNGFYHFSKITRKISRYGLNGGFGFDTWWQNGFRLGAHVGLHSSFTKELDESFFVVGLRFGKVVKFF